MTTALAVLAVAALSLALLGYTVLLTFRDTPARRSTPPASHHEDAFARGAHRHDLAA